MRPTFEQLREESDLMDDGNIKRAADLRQEAADLRATANESPYRIQWYGEAKARVLEHQAQLLERNHASSVNLSRGHRES